MEDRRETARRLLQRLGAPLGTVTIHSERLAEGYRLVVRVSPGLRLPPDACPSLFEGYPVTYETRRPAKPLRVA